MSDIIDKMSLRLAKDYYLKDVKRYNNVFKIKDESVAEHCYFVAKTVLALHELYLFDLQKALVMALIHDQPEYFITDIPHNVKEKYPSINNAIKEAESKLMKEEFPQYFDSYIEFEYQTSVEAVIVKLADVLSCFQYSCVEIQLGNKGYMNEVMDASAERARVHAKDLEKFRR